MNKIDPTAKHLNSLTSISVMAIKLRFLIIYTIRSAKSSSDEGPGVYNFIDVKIFIGN
jgi:hypothetical protein